MSFKNSNSGSSGGAMTSQLKQLLGVQSPGRPTQQRVVQTQILLPGLEQVQATPDSSIQPTSFSRIRIKCVKSKSIQLGSTFWGYRWRASSSNSSHQTNDALGSGEQLDADMRKWASAEMQKMKGNSDLTLVSFCMTLSSNSEIREYMRDVLGSTPQVSSFASEFIRRKK